MKLVRRPSGFDFSVKGGAEHGVPIIVSAVEKGGAAGRYNVYVHVHEVVTARLVDRQTGREIERQTDRQTDIYVAFLY